MKHYLLTVAACLISIGLFAQTETPAMSQLAKMKSYSESQFKLWFSNETIPNALPNRVGFNAAQLHKVKRDSLEKSLQFISKYNNLKCVIDELIVQLKADMVLANSRKRLKQFNQGIQDPNSWYGKKFAEIESNYATYVQEFIVAFEAASISDITGIFTAITGVVTSARDHRLEKVKLLNEQLEGLRLKPYYELMDAKSKE